jgi:uncharacterized protein (TIGR02145 family)
MIIGYLNNVPQKITIKRPCQGYYLRWWYNGWHYFFFKPGKQSLNTEGEKYRTIGTKSILIGTGQITYDQCSAIRTIMNTREVYIFTSDGWKNVSIAPGSLVIFDNQVNGYEVELNIKIGSREISVTGFSPILPDVRVFDPNVITIITVINGTFTIVVTGTPGETIIITWGDGTTETIILTGGTQTITHDYDNPDGGEITITIDGEEHITTIDISDDDIIDIYIPDTTILLTDLDISGNKIVVIPHIPPTVITVDITDNPLVICQVQIGTQVWMCKNYDSNFPGSKVYNNDEANRALYGGLYTIAQVNTPGFCPYGYHVPTEAEWMQLINYIGGLAVAGGHLKEAGITRWNNPNTDADNTSGFTAVGGGIYYSGSFYSLKELGNLWCKDAFIFIEKSSGAVQVVSLTDYLIQTYTSMNYSIGVRLIRNWAAIIPPVVDVDGNVYTYVTIGTQQWLVENLKTTKYADGTPIPNLTVDGAWAADTNGAYCWYNNDIANKTPYGALYNWYAATNVHGIAPTGWRVPNQADMVTLITYLGLLAGGQLKEQGLTHWQTPNTDATDNYGFKAIGAGIRMYNDGSFSSFKQIMGLFTSENSGLYYYFQYDSGSDYNATTSKKFGLSIRCMRDI